MKEKFIDRICLEARPAEIDLAPQDVAELIQNCVAWYKWCLWCHGLF